MAQKFELIRLKQAKGLEKQHKSSQNLSDHNQSSLIGKSTARADQEYSISVVDQSQHRVDTMDFQSKDGCRSQLFELS